VPFRPNEEKIGSYGYASYYEALSELEKKKPKHKVVKKKLALYSNQLPQGIHRDCSVVYKEAGDKGKILVGFENENGKIIESFSVEESYKFTIGSKWKLFVKNKGDFDLTRLDNGNWLLTNQYSVYADQLLNSNTQVEFNGQTYPISAAKSNPRLMQAVLQGGFNRFIKAKNINLDPRALRSGLQSVVEYQNTKVRAASQ